MKSVKFVSAAAALLVFLEITSACRAAPNLAELITTAAVEAIAKLVLEVPRKESPDTKSSFDPSVGFVGLSRSRIREPLIESKSRARDRVWFSMHEQADRFVVKVGVSTKYASSWFSINFLIANDRVTSADYAIHFVDAALQDEENRSTEHELNSGSRAHATPV